ncbi:hypothetical protein L3A09_08975 [Streptococcus pneumoniae]|nr:hypothetical protein [Streptococcus pneumoniae]
MASKINATERIAIIIDKQKIEVVTTLNYDMSITKDWLPKSKEFDDWVGYSPSMAQVVIAVYLIYRGN